MSGNAVFPAESDRAGETGRSLPMLETHLIKSSARDNTLT